MSSKKMRCAPEQPPGNYAALPHAVIESTAYRDASSSAKVVLIALLRQHTGRNNGHLRATSALMERYAGIKSNDTITRAIVDLISHGLVVCTKRGGLNAGAARYGVTWLNLTDCRGLDFTAEAFRVGEWQFYKPTESDERPRRDTSNASRARSELARRRREATSAKSDVSDNDRSPPSYGRDCTDYRFSPIPSDSAALWPSAPSIGAKFDDFDRGTAPSGGDKCTVPGAEAPERRSEREKTGKRKA